MKRKLINDMAVWKEDLSKKPLLLYGIKGVGKTYLALEFADSYYDGSIYVNFETSYDICDEFLKNSNEDFLEIISRFYQLPMQLLGNILIILDEIRRFPAAYNSFLEFYLKNPDIHNVLIISSDLLLKSDADSFECIRLMPLDFEEFLAANGNEWYSDIIKAHSQNFRKVPEIVHNELSNLFEDYIIIGGMPAAINEYLLLEKNNNTTEVQKNIFNNVLADFDNICSEAAAFKCRQLLNTAGIQLLKSNRKFQYRYIRKGVTYNMLKESIDILSGCGHAVKCRKLIKNGYDDSVFKLYIWDTGILNMLITKAGAFPENALDIKRNPNTIKRALVENYVINSLNALNINNCFWESEAAARAECVITLKNGNLIPVDIRLKENEHSKSMGIFKNTFKSPYILKTGYKNFELSEEVRYIPLYALYALREENL